MPRHGRSLSGRTGRKRVDPASLVAPADQARRRARRQRVVWILALIVVLVAAVWVGHLLWDSYFSAGEPVSGDLTP